MTLFGENGLGRILSRALLLIILSGLSGLLGLTVLSMPVLGGYEDLENEVREINLDNGLTILLLERHDVPVFSFWTYVKVGGVDEEVGLTGIAHMFEHMAFKGTRDLGTFDYRKERRVLSKMDDVYDELQAERLRGVDGDQELIGELEAEFELLQDEADELVDSNAFGRLVETAGGKGLNAMTSADATQYFYSYPSNRLELWAALESDRFINPVLREFYKERNVILEERNMRTESNPQGRLFEEWLAVAYKGHPYGQPAIGHRSDIEAYSRRDAYEFYEKHYGARSMVIAVVGDVYHKELKDLADKYFAKIPPGPGELPIRTVEPRQKGERRVVLEEAAQPFLLIGYHVPEARHPDTPAYEALADIVGQGRSSRLNTKLVKEDKQAAFVGSFPGLPGSRYPGLLTMIAVPNKDVDPGDLEASIYEVLAEVAENGVSEEELAGYKTRARAQFIESLEGNMGMAAQLCNAHKLLGDWRELFRGLDKIEEVTTADVKRVAAETFRRENRTVGTIVTKSDSDS